MAGGQARHRPETCAVNYQFTNKWFELTAEHNFAAILPKLKPVKVLEIGSYEGRAMVWMAEQLRPKELVCIDTWRGGNEHHGVNMSAVYDRWMHNAREVAGLGIQPSAMRGDSVKMLMALENVGRTFDFVYVDGSHRAPDVLSDAVLGFRLLNPGGVIAFDDYAWTEQPIHLSNPLHNPRLAIDAFVNVYRHQLQPLNCNTAQFWALKL